MRRDPRRGRHEAVRLAVSVGLDEGTLVSGKAHRHLQECAECRAFRDGVIRVRELVRTASVPAPDLVPAIMARVRAEAAAQRAVTGRATVRARPHAPGLPVATTRPRPGRGPRVRRPMAAWIRRQRVSIAAAAAGLVIGLVLTSGGVVPLRRDPTAALAGEIPRRLVGAAESLQGYRARFDIVERNWTAKVEVRRFQADVAFRAPEALRVEVRDLTAYPSAEWPRNNLLLVTDGRSWHTEGPDPCPAAAFPACPEAGSVDRTVVGRPPFHAESATPTDVIVPMTVLAASNRVEVVGPGEVAGREAVVVQIAFRDAAPLLQYVRFLGSWRPFYPQDPVLVWLDRSTWFPLRYEVFPAPGAARAGWASQMGLPREPSTDPVFTAVASSLSTSLPPPEVFDVDAAASAVDLGFRDRRLGSLSGSRVAPPLPRDPVGLEPWRWGRFAPETRSYREVVVAYARGLAWLAVARVTGWAREQSFGVGPLAEAVRLPNGVGYYEPASATAPRRIALHTREGEILVSTNLPRAELLRVAGSIPVAALPVPESWLVRRWAGGEVRSGLSPAEAISAAGFEVLLPTYLPPGYAAAVAELVRGPEITGISIVHRRPAAELDGLGLRLYQATDQTLPPPTEPGAQAVALRGLTARWSPEAQVLEWVEDGIYRSLSGPGFDLALLVRVAESLRPAHEASP